MNDSAVTVVPSVNFQPSLSVIVYWVESAFGLIESATSFSASPLALKAMRLANSSWPTLPPPVSLVSPGISAFCGSELYAVMMLSPEPLAELPPLEPQALRLSIMPSEQMPAMRPSVFFFMVSPIHMQTNTRLIAAGLKVEPSTPLLITHHYCHTSRQIKIRSRFIPSMHLICEYVAICAFAESPSPIHEE